MATCDVKLGNRDGFEGPPGNAIVKGWSKSIFDGATDNDARGRVAAAVGVAILSLSLLLEEDGEDGDLGSGGAEGRASERPLFREGDLQLAVVEI